MGVLDKWGQIGRGRRIRRTARDVFDWEQLRPGQAEAIHQLLKGRDVLVVMPTGSGKSAAYQVPAQLLDGPTIVISPLIALQRDQMISLAERNAGGAVVVNSAQRKGAGEASLEQVRAGKAEYVFLSPEQLAKPEIVDLLAEARPSLIAIDEAHCVSGWGHDFRPDYLRLGRVIERLGHPPVIALTATASPPVRQDIIETLGLRDPYQVIRGFDRPNIALGVRRFSEESAKRRALVADAAGRSGLGLVYVATRRDATAYAKELAAAGLRAEAYHAGMKASERERVHALFADDGVDVVVATSAFGMGIDKPNVRYVLHSAPPESPDSYYQEIGRAGRDGEPSEAVLFYRSEDLGLRRFFAGGRPDEKTLLRLATLLHEHGGTVAPRAVRDTLGVGASKLTGLVNLLEQADAIEVADRGELRYAEDGPAPDKAVAEALEFDESRRRVDDSRIDMMRGYAETTGCRRRYLLEYFGEPCPRTCGNCGNCVAGSAAPDPAPAAASAGTPFPVRSRGDPRVLGRGHGDERGVRPHHRPVRGDRLQDPVAGGRPARLSPDPRPELDVGRWWTVALVAALLAGMAVAMVTTAVAQSPTIDEPVYAGTAVVYLRRHSLAYNPEHPPLGKLVIETGLAFAHPRLDPAFAGDEGALGRHVLYESGGDARRLMLAARLPIIALTLLFGLVVFLFARDLTGPLGGTVALALYAFSPDVIAHGSLATLDVPVAGFLLTSAWLMWRARERPLRYLPLAGAALGAAVATKMSALPAVPVLMALAFLTVSRRRDARPGPPERRDAQPDVPVRRGVRPGVPVWRGVRLGLAAAAGVALIAVAVVWASYLAVDPRLRWAAPPHLPAVHGPRALAASWLPLPRPYRDGMRIQFGYEDATWSGFLFGRQYQGPLWYYLPAALLVKTPLGALALWLAGAVSMVALPRLRPAAPYVLVPAAVLLAAAMDGTRDLGTRYAVFLPMFLAVAAASVTLMRWRAVWIALILFTAVSSARAFPYYLPYSNEAFGGPSRTYLRLHDSNVDWGQDLDRLADRLRDRYPGERVWLVYKGSGVPPYYGIHAADPLTVPPDQVTGLLVVSDTAIDKADARLAALLATSRRIDDVGHSMTIFRRP